VCGMGKSGTMHAWEQEGISGPDIQTVGKALGGGFIPLSAAILNQKIFDALASGSGGLAHGHTFQASHHWLYHEIQHVKANSS
jgi:adenosylmethionine-8-amino-7-oxononanoate aminotransferase